MSTRSFSIVEFFGGDAADAEASSCGYCKNRGSVSTGMWAHNLNVLDYQDLIDRGWRRSGCYCYKPKMNVTCCPAYTIKCDARKFKLSKSQKKVLKRINKFLLEGSQIKVENIDPKSHLCEEEVEEEETIEILDLPDLTSKAEKISGTPKIVESSILEKHDSPQDSKDAPSLTVTTPVRQISAEKTSELKETGSLRPCKKAKLLRKERRAERLLKKGLNPDELNPKADQEGKTLKQHLESLPNTKHKLELRLVQTNPASDEYKATENESYEVYKKYQICVHDDPEEKVTLRQFTRFLVDSPLEPEQGENGITYGSFHQQYWLDGKLIAVAVIDILPKCLSSVYFYYDPDYRFLTLGTYAALREIALTQELNRKSADLASYYMGFYIHSCPKMRYKGQYSPSYLLCPVSYTWHPIEMCKPLLDNSKYSVFSQEEVEKPVVINDLCQMKILYKRKAITFAMYSASQRLPLLCDEISTLKLYFELVGSACATRMLLFRE
ncbi:Hypothetical predicted protein [Cloeon dipterum]|uniref:Arginyl-tRNA--protein transferase 1 n=1 Tax=Cloeon dipterum TaxID=197152 RepID=A0A8S1C4P0_9INSE|nr:Hypothetical predicted protein [Cloeon dipterum]